MKDGAIDRGPGCRGARVFLAGVTVVWGMSLLMACVPPKVQTQRAPQFEPTAIKSVAVMPFQTVETPQWGSQGGRGGVRDPEEIRTQFRLPGTDQVSPEEARKNLYVVPAVGAQRLTGLVVSALAARPSLRVVGPDVTATLVPEGEEKSITSFQALAQEAGTGLGVDGVMVGLVRTYREREGSKLGAKPAALGFELYLVRPSDGVVLWKGEFYEEQKPLTEDIVGFFEKGGGFVTVGELAEIGVAKVMKAFPVGLASVTR